MKKTIDKGLRAEQVRLLYMNSRFGIFALIPCSLILVYVLKDSASLLVLVSWMGLNWLVAAFRYLLTRKYLLASLTCDESKRWEMYFNVGLFFAGAAFGSSALMLGKDSVVQHVFFAFVAGGMMAGSVGSYSAILRSFLIYNIPLMLPVMLHLFSHGREVNILMGKMFLLYFVALTILSRQAYLANISSLKLRFEKEELLEKVIESEERFRKLSEATFEGIVIHRDGIVLDVNRRFAEMFGFEVSEGAGKSLLDFVSPQFCEQVDARLAEHDDSPCESLGVKSDGRAFNISAQGRHMDYKGEPARFTVIRDVTAQKLAEEKLKQSELSYRTLTENLPGIVYRLIPGGESSINFYNKMLFPLTGYSSSEILSYGLCALEQLIVKEDRDRVHESIMNAVRLKVPFEIEYRICKKDAEVRSFFERGRPIYDSQGTLLHIDGFVIDITLRKVKCELEFMVRIYRDIFDALDKVFFSMDTVNDKLLLISKNCNKIYGISQDAFKDNPRLWREVINPDDLERVDEALQKLTDGETVSLEYRIYHADGSIRWIGSNIVPTLNESGLVRINGINEDITERKTNESKLLEYSYTQEELLKEVNHRVKNNLIAIIGMLRMETRRARQEGYLDLLQNLIGRVSSLSSVHSMLSSKGWRPLRISSLVNEIALSTLRSMMQHQAYDFSVTPSELRISKTQAHHLAMLINELVLNSVKHSEADDTLKIELGIEKHTGGVKIIYRDNGKGFPASILKGYKNKDTMGLDLILGIATESLRGEVSIFNENGANTVISFRLNGDESKGREHRTCMAAFQ